MGEVGVMGVVWRGMVWQAMARYWPRAGWMFVRITIEPTVDTKLPTVSVCVNTDTGTIEEVVDLVANALLGWGFSKEVVDFGLRRTRVIIRGKSRTW